MDDGRTHEERKAEMQLKHTLEQDALTKEHERQKAVKHDAQVHQIERGVAWTVGTIILVLVSWSLYQLSFSSKDDKNREFATLLIHLVLGAALPLTAGGLWTKWRDRG